MKCYKLDWKQGTLFFDIEFARSCLAMNQVHSLTTQFSDLEMLLVNSDTPFPVLINDWKEHFCSLLISNDKELQTNFEIQNYHISFQDIGNYCRAVTEAIKTIHESTLAEKIQLEVELSVRDEDLLFALATFETSRIQL